jgi:hypothetical protein
MNNITTHELVQRGIHTRRVWSIHRAKKNTDMACKKNENPNTIAIAGRIAPFSSVMFVITLVKYSLNCIFN